LLCGDRHHGGKQKDAESPHARDANHINRRSNGEPVCKIGGLYRLLIAVVVLIIYGSLYPWHFEWRELPASPAWILLHSWEGRLSRRFLADILVNVALYIPLGAAGHLAFRRLRIAGPVVLGMLLSASIEMLQLFTPGRNCSAVDLLTNTAGSALGVLCGMIFQAVAGSRIRGTGPMKTTDPAALALLFCWLGSLLFPFFPVTRLVTIREDLQRFAVSPWFQPLPFLSAAASWFAAGRLLNALPAPIPGLSALLYNRPGERAGQVGGRWISRPSGCPGSCSVSFWRGPGVLVDTFWRHAGNKLAIRYSRAGGESIFLRRSHLDDSLRGDALVPGNSGCDAAADRDRNPPDIPSRPYSGNYRPVARNSYRAGARVTEQTASLRDYPMVALR
jgi:hypothetical protein